MLYFAYGSNLNHFQMKHVRCLGSKYIKAHYLKDYKIIFSHPNKSNKLYVSSHILFILVATNSCGVSLESFT